MKQPKLQFEHPTQLAASTFLRAVSEGDAIAMWTALSRESRGLLQGLYAARAGVSLRSASGVQIDGTDERLGAMLAPLRATILEALGGAEQIGGYGVSNARLLDRPRGGTPAAMDVQVYNLDELEREAIRKAMVQSGGVVASAAKLLGIDRRTLQRKLRRIT